MSGYFSLDAGPAWVVSVYDFSRKMVMPASKLKLWPSFLPGLYQAYHGSCAVQPGSHMWGQAALDPIHKSPSHDCSLILNF